VMSTSALLRRGPSYMRVLHAELASWLKEHEYESVRQMRGSMSRANCPDPSAYERANYMRTLVEFVGEAP
jgi:dihydroorotate dehydrogenase (fumarate)